MSAMLIRAACVFAAATMLPARSPQTRMNVAEQPPLQARAGQAVEVRVASEKALQDAWVTSEALGWDHVRMGHHTHGTANEMGALPLVPRNAAAGSYAYRIDAVDRDGRALVVVGTVSVE